MSTTSAELYLSFVPNNNQPRISPGAAYYYVDRTGAEQKQGCVASTVGTPSAGSKFIGKTWGILGGLEALTTTTSGPPLQVTFPPSTLPTSIDSYFGQSNVSGGVAAFTPTFSTSTPITDFKIYYLYGPGQSQVLELLPSPDSPTPIPNSGWTIQLTSGSIGASQTGGYVITQTQCTPSMCLPLLELQIFSESPIQSIGIGPSSTNMSLQLLTPWPQASIPAPPPAILPNGTCQATTPSECTDCNQQCFLNGEIVDISLLGGTCPTSVSSSGFQGRRIHSLQKKS
jgi:hypothetical protein